MSYERLPHAAKRIGISRVTLWLWVKRGEVKANRIGKVYTVNSDEIDKIIENGLKHKIAR